MRAELQAHLRAVARGEVSPKGGVTGVPGVTQRPSYVSKPLELQRLRALRAENQKAEDGVAKGVTNPGAVGSLKGLGDAPSGGADIESDEINAAINPLEVITPLRSSRDGRTIEDWQALFDEGAGRPEYDIAVGHARVAYERCIVEWLNRNPANSSPGMCAWCGGHERQGAPILPFGVTPHGHTWLHGECWKPWYDDRCRQARAALSLLGIREKVRGP
jgi:hypothetical protein